MAEFKAHFFIDEKSSGAMGARAPLPRFALTFPAAITAQINDMAVRLGIDQISLCKAILLAGVSSYQENPEPFIEEVARAKMRIAESLTLAARDLETGLSK